jgi:hypothetical protein
MEPLWFLNHLAPDYDRIWVSFIPPEPAREGEHPFPLGFFPAKRVGLKDQEVR